MKNSKQPITPTMYTKFGSGEDDYKPLNDGQKTGYEVKFGGLTKREYFAAKAMQGLLAKEAWLERNENDIKFNTIIAKAAVNIADQLLKELEKTT